MQVVLRATLSRRLPLHLDLNTFSALG